MKKSLLFLIPIIAAVAYLGGAMYFNSRFLPNTYINNVNVGCMLPDEAKTTVEEGSAPGTLELVKNDGTVEKVNLSSLEHTSEIADIEKIMYGQNSFMWVSRLFSKETFEVEESIEYNLDGLDAIIDELKCVTSQKVSPPQDARVEKTESGYVIVPETEGSLIDKAMLKEAIIDAIFNGETFVNLSEKDCYVKAEITTKSESIMKFSNLMDNINSLTITYDFSDRTEVLDSSTLNSWITLDDMEIVVDEDKAKQFVTNMAYKYDTYGKSREFTTTDGETITISTGIYGWQTDVEKTTRELIETIKKCESVTIKPEYKLYGLSRDVNDIGDTYVEISIDKQHMWYYKDGEVFLESDIVTGLTNGKRDTPKGVFCIWSREKDRTLGTYAVQGYESHVDYWMPIDWTGVGLHDASWRSSFGGQIYKTNGSHGCINLPSAVAKNLFENCVTGTPVVIY